MLKWQFWQGIFLIIDGNRLHTISSSYGLGREGSSEVERVLGVGVEPFSGAAEGDAGQDEGEGNSLMVTVRRLVVTSVTTTSWQLGAISGRQSGSPSAGTLWGSEGVELLWPGATAGADAVLSEAASWRFGWLGRSFCLPPSGGTKRSSPSSSSLPSKEEDAVPEGAERDEDEGRKGDAVATGFGTEDGAEANCWVFWFFWGSD